MWHRRQRADSEANVVAASIRLLEGDAVGLFRESGQGAPAWAYLNALAHSDLPRLIGLKNPPRVLHPGGWDAAVAYLATEVLSMGHERDDPLLIQRDVLVPLELAVLGHEAPEPETPAQLADVVIDALRRRRPPFRDVQHRLTTPPSSSHPNQSQSPGA